MPILRCPPRRRPAVRCDSWVARFGAVIALGREPNPAGNTADGSESCAHGRIFRLDDVDCGASARPRSSRSGRLTVAVSDLELSA